VFLFFFFQADVAVRVNFALRGPGEV